MKVNLKSKMDSKKITELFFSIEALGGMFVRVGVPDSLSAVGTSLTLAQVAIINEFGTSTIPARPFLQRGVEQSIHEGVRRMAKSMTKIGNAKKMRSRGRYLLGRLGAFVAGKVKEGMGYSILKGKRIVLDNGFVPNAPSTIKRKGSSMPLIDTGLLRQSITWLVGSTK